MEFEWDITKANQNIEKHGVTFEEGASVFDDDFSLTVSDPDHSAEENRFLIFGLSKQQNHLVVSFTDRGDRIRIISARRMSRREIQAYE
ncbi:MAG: BrnT family toxin [Pseudomonadales bacterium]